MSDERLGLPSASSASRYAACLGSWQLEKQIAEGAVTNDATIGNRIHSALAMELVDNLTSDETWTIDRCREQELELVKATFPEATEEPNVWREKRLWSIDDRGVKLWSGKPDVIYVVGSAGLIIDYKSGRGAVENAAENLQLRCLVALLDENFGFTFDRITVAIVQPLAGPPSVAVYESQDIRNAIAESADLMEQIQKIGHPRTPSESACKYCKGKPFCPEARELAVAGPLTNTPEGITPDAIAATLTNQTLAAFLDRSAQAEAVIEACRTEARRRLAEGSIDLMRIEASSQCGSIDDVKQVPNCVEILNLIGGLIEFLGFFVDQSIPQVLRHRIWHDWSGWDVLLECPHELADEFHWVGLVHLIRVSVG